jgi:hypothetical protein
MRADQELLIAANDQIMKPGEYDDVIFAYRNGAPGFQVDVQPLPLRVAPALLGLLVELTADLGS